MQNVLSPAFWSKVLIGDVVSLKDKQALQDAMQRGLGAVPLDYEIKSIRVLNEVEDLGQWRLYQLVDGTQDIWLMVKIVDQEVDIRAYYTPDSEFTQGNRAFQVSSGGQWLFKNGEENVAPLDLEYADEIFYSNMRYVEKDEAYVANTWIAPPLAGLLSPFLSIVKEYSTSEWRDNPELLVIEFGGADGVEGGSIWVFIGSPLNTEDFDIHFKGAHK